MTIEMDAAEPESARRARQQVRGLGAAVAVLLVLGLVGLAVVDGPTRSSKSAVAAVLDAAAKTTEASSARIDVKGGVRVQGRSMPTIGVKGVVQFAGERRSSLTLSFGPVSVDMVTVGATAYVKVPDSARGPSGSATPWVSIDASSLNTEGPFAGLSGPTLGGGDPTSTLRELRAAGVVKSATTAGRATVRGVKTTVYHAVLDPEALKAKTLETQKAVGNDLASSAADLFKFSKAEMDLFVDGQGLVRRQVISLAVAAGGGGGGSFDARIESTAELYDFGVAVNIQPPPASQVTNLGSPALLAPLLQGGR